MAFTIDEAFLPATLTAPAMTDSQFADFCAEHPDLFFEMTAAGEIIVIPPTFSLTGIRKPSQESMKGYWHLCPAFVIELRSHSDQLPVIRAKMQECIANGAQLGWMIDAEARALEVYRPDREAELLTGVNSIAGEGPVEGFVLDLRAVWDPLAA